MFWNRLGGRLENEFNEQTKTISSYKTWQTLSHSEVRFRLIFGTFCTVHAIDVLMEKDKIYQCSPTVIAFLL